MTRGGKRPGAGGKKPPLPKGKKRINYTIKFSPLEMRRIKQAAREQGSCYTTFIRLAALRAANWILDNNPPERAEGKYFGANTVKVTNKIL